MVHVDAGSQPKTSLKRDASHDRKVSVSLGQGAQVSGSFTRLSSLVGACYAARGLHAINGWSATIGLECALIGLA